MQKIELDLIRGMCANKGDILQECVGPFCVFVTISEMEKMMIILKSAIAGTLESSDAQITLEPLEGELEIDIQSSVQAQYGKQIRASVLETLNRLEVRGAHVTVVDRGALDCTLRARVESVVFRAAGIYRDYPWGGAIR